jgi:four helix bundle protein
MYNTEEKNESTEKTVSFFRFEDLRIYHKSLDYINWLQDASMLFPENDNTGLSERFNASARNITLYITEGSARNKSQFIHYLKMAKTSIRECVVLTTIAYQANFLSETYEQESRQYLMELTKMSGALISSLQRAQNAQGNYNGNYHGNGNAYNNDADGQQEDVDYNYNRDN